MKKKAKSVKTKCTCNPCKLRMQLPQRKIGTTKVGQLHLGRSAFFDKRWYNIEMKSNTRGNQKLQVLESILQSDTEGLRRFILSIVQSPTDAEDILQNGIVRCIEKAVELKDPSKARAWVLSVFRNLALDFLRERQKNLLLISPTTPSELEMLPDPKESITENSICGCVAELMKELPKNYSSLLNEVEIEGESVKQLAKELGSSPNKLSVQLHRARKSLKTALKEKCEVETYASCLECEC